MFGIEVMVKPVFRDRCRVQHVRYVYRGENERVIVTVMSLLKVLFVTRLCPGIIGPVGHIQ